MSSVMIDVLHTLVDDDKISTSSKMSGSSSAQNGAIDTVAVLAHGLSQGTALTKFGFQGNVWILVTPYGRNLRSGWESLMPANMKTYANISWPIYDAGARVTYGQNQVLPVKGWLFPEGDDATFRQFADTMQSIVNYIDQHAGFQDPNSRLDDLRGDALRKRLDDVANILATGVTVITPTDGSRASSRASTRDFNTPIQPTQRGRSRRNVVPVPAPPQFVPTTAPQPRGQQTQPPAQAQPVTIPQPTGAPSSRFMFNTGSAPRPHATSSSDFPSHIDSEDYETQFSLRKAVYPALDQTFTTSGVENGINFTGKGKVTQVIENNFPRVSVFTDEVVTLHYPEGDVPYHGKEGEVKVLYLIGDKWFSDFSSEFVHWDAHEDPKVKETKVVSSYAQSDFEGNKTVAKFEFPSFINEGKVTKQVFIEYLRIPKIDAKVEVTTVTSQGNIVTPGKVISIVDANPISQFTVELDEGHAKVNYNIISQGGVWRVANATGTYLEFVKPRKPTPEELAQNTRFGSSGRFGAAPGMSGRAVAPTVPALPAAPAAPSRATTPTATMAPTNLVPGPSTSAPQPLGQMGVATQGLVGRDEDVQNQADEDLREDDFEDQ